MTSSPPKTVLLIDHERYGLVLFEKLVALGHEIILGYDSDEEPALHSRYCKQTWRHAPFDQSTAFIDDLKTYLDTTPAVSWVIPIGENGVAALARAYDELPRRVDYIISDPQTVLACLDKAISCERVAAAGVPLPKSLPVRSPTDLETAITEIGLPCLIKPNSTCNRMRTIDGISSEKAIPIETDRDLDWVRKNITFEYPLLVQEYVSGLRTNSIMAARNGSILDYFQCKTQRTTELNGTGYGVLTTSETPTPELMDYCERIVRSLDYTGIIGIQYLWDRNREQHLFLEVNPRLPGNVKFCCQLGCDLVHHMLNLSGFLGANVPEIQQTAYLPGKRSTFIHGEFTAWLAHCRKGEISPGQSLYQLLRMIFGLLRTKSDSSLSLHDPKPGLYVFSGTIGRTLRRIWNRIFRTHSEYWTV